MKKKSFPKITITKLTAREILDSRGNPTIEVTAFSGKFLAIASVPSGASTGVHEAHELRDGDKKRFLGQGVKKAVHNVESVIFPAIKNISIFDQESIDTTMLEIDGTPTKSKLGANAILGVSLATARLASVVAGIPLYRYLANYYNYKPKALPTVLFNVLNGGKHADSGLDIQEFFLIPKKGDFLNRLNMVHKVIANLKTDLTKRRLSIAVGDEGGVAPRLKSNQAALRILAKAIENSGYKLGRDVGIGMDAAASEFFNTDREVYELRADNKHYKPASIYKMYQRWIRDYKLEVIEDGCAEDDFLGWQQLTKHVGKQTLLVGDDLFVTNPERIQLGLVAGIANATLIKPNQIGTLTETLQAIKLSQKHNYKVVISHRSGETVDDFISDLAVAVNADFMKAGSLSRGERLAKYNRLLKINDELNHH